LPVCPARLPSRATLLYRLVSYWIPIPTGAVAYLLFRHRYRGRGSLNGTAEGDEGRATPGRQPQPPA
jgi:hypothetical protein